MKKRVHSLVAALLLGSFAYAQTLTQSNFTCNVIPQVMGSGTSTRLPVVIRATVSGLAPTTVYRYYTNLALATDLGTTNSGAGNPLFPRASSFLYTTGASLATANNYDSLTTDASGNYTGWFAIVNTGNARFTAGNYVYPTIVLDSAGSKRGIVNSRFAATDSILVLAYNTAATTTSGTGIRGTSAATDKNIVLLYDNTNGTGRPLTACFVETTGTTIASTVSFYTSNVQGVSGAWGSIIPNMLPNGVKRIEHRSLSTGAMLNANTSTNAMWGTTGTVNPAGGTTAISIASLDAPLPVTWKSFTAHKDHHTVQLEWVTASEINNSHFDIQRSNDGLSFETIGTVSSEGNSQTVHSYNFQDVAASPANRIYYRLKQVDRDGQFSFSKTECISSTTQQGITTIFPNPVSGNLNMVIHSSTDVTVDLSITNMRGISYPTVSEQVHVGANTISIATSNLPAGIYLLRISTNGETHTHTLIKE